MAALNYAIGHRAWGECQRCGARVRYTELVEDGYVPGLLVEQSCYEPPHPLDEPVVLPADAEALAHPSPEVSIPDAEGEAAPAIGFDAYGNLTFDE